MRYCMVEIIICLFKGHEYGEWYNSGDKIARDCKRCGKVHHTENRVTDGRTVSVRSKKCTMERLQPEIDNLLKSAKKTNSKKENRNTIENNEDKRTPQDIWKETETILNLVDSYFKNVDKTILWFKTPNPLLGNQSPKGMIEKGRFNKLHIFVINQLKKEK